MKLTSIKKTTKEYEAWLAKHTTLVADDLTHKHQLMAENPFTFLRGTFYRWSQVWPQICSNLTKTPAVLAVGDLHVENYGTWRDSDGRLIWGINDFDEAYPMPYTTDLVRLAASALLAKREKQLSLPEADIFSSILDGYSEALAANGQPFVLAEHHAWMRGIANAALQDPVVFWKRMDMLQDARAEVTASAREAMESQLPAPQLPYHVYRRQAGIGSLGHARFVAVAEWCGGAVAREAKALVPSAYLWARGTDTGPIEIFYQAILSQARRAWDPFVLLRGLWIVRRLAPDCTRISLTELPAERDEARLLHAMGWEAANIHLGTIDAIPAVRRDLERQPQDWLQTAAEAMAKVTVEDWAEWKQNGII
jgi:hypothetical protein